MSGEPFSMSFDPKSLSELNQFYGFSTMLSEEVQAAMQEASDTLIASVQGNMHWKNPTGALEDSIHKVNDSPYEIEIGSDLPYARRREFGFSGMVDSLGRYFPNDPGAFYFAAAAAQEHDNIFGLIETAAQRAFDRITGS